MAVVRTFYSICFVLITLCFLFAGVCQGQSLVFVSPNTRGHMSGEFALESQDSFEQRNFVAVARYLAARLCPRSEVSSGEGMDGSGTENTALVAGCSNREAVYLGELLGRYAHQKWILIFNRAQKSDQRLFVIEFASAQPTFVIAEMRKYGLHQGTIILKDNANAVRVYIWVSDNSKDDAVYAFADSNQGKIEEVHGTGILIGNDSRGLAQRVFDRGIASHERKHRPALSPLLWSRKLHDLDSQPVTPLRTPQSP